jgi:hypothetical protein
MIRAGQTGIFIDFHYLIDRLGQQYKPIGDPEELEAQRIAACWCRLKRARRCENAEIVAQAGQSADYGIVIYLVRSDLLYILSKILAKKISEIVLNWVLES